MDGDFLGDLVHAHDVLALDVDLAGLAEVALQGPVR